MLAILGLTSSADGTILRVQASSPARDSYYGPPPRTGDLDTRQPWTLVRHARPLAVIYAGQNLP